MLKTLTTIVLALALIVSVFFAYTKKLRSGPSLAGGLAIRGGTLIDGTGRPPLNNAVILIADGSIKQVFREGEGVIPKGVRIVEAGGQTILPGFIDGNTHLMIGSGGAASSAAEFMPERVLRDLRACLFWGITTVHTTADPLASISRLRDNERDGLINASRISMDGPVLTAVGGYPALFLPAMVAAEATRQIDSVEAARKSIEELTAASVNMVNVVYDGGNQENSYPKLSPALLKEIIDQSHAVNLRISARVGSLSDLKEAIRAGIDGIDQGPFDLLDEEAIQLMLEQGVYYCSNIAAGQSATLEVNEIDALLQQEVVRRTVSPDIRDSLAKHSGYYFELKNDAVARGYFHAALRNRLQNLKLAADAGVKIVLGTGAGDPAVFYGISLHDELRLMVQAGLSPMQALVAGTRTAAEYLNLNSTLGTVEAGRAANLLLIDGDPLQDIAATRKIRQVIKDAQVIDTEQLLQ